MALQGLLARLQARIRESETAKAVIRRGLIRAGFDAIDTADGAKLIRIPPHERPNYRPFYAPWRGADAEFAALWAEAGAGSMLNQERLWVVYATLQHVLATGGEIWEAGTYQGGTAHFLRLARDRWARRTGCEIPLLRLFDTFEGMPPTDPQRDRFAAGAFADTSVERVRTMVGGESVELHAGLIPDTFTGLDASAVAWLHVDVDLYSSVMDTLRFGWPRLVVGGVVLVDDYGFPNAPGCREAVDEFFERRTAFPLVLETGQALVWKTSAGDGP